MVTTNWKSIIDTQGRKKKSKHNIKVSHQITREENKRRKEGKKTYKTKPKQLTKSKNIYINNQIKCEWIKCFNRETDWIQNKTHIYAVYKRHIHIWGSIQIENEGIEKGIPCKCKSKESWSSNTHVRQNRLQRLLQEQRKILRKDEW